MKNKKRVGMNKLDPVCKSIKLLHNFQAIDAVHSKQNLQHSPKFNFSVYDYGTNERLEKKKWDFFLFY